MSIFMSFKNDYVQNDLSHEQIDEKMLHILIFLLVLFPSWDALIITERLQLCNTKIMEKQKIFTIVTIK